MVNLKECEKYKKKCFSVNVVGSKKVYEACQKAKINKFIFISTSHVYGYSNKLKFFTTRSKLNPKSYYAFSKVRAEKELIKLNKKNSYTELYIARVFSVLAKKIRKGSLQDKINKMLTKKRINYIKGMNNVRDFMTSKEICRKIIEYAIIKDCPKITNICSGKPAKIYDIVKKIYKVKKIDFDTIYKFESKEIPNYLVGKPSFDD